MDTHEPPSPTDSPAPDANRLKETFTAPFPAHASRWDSLWRESYTPWDRGGPSLALADFLSDQFSHSMQFSIARPRIPIPRSQGDRKKALVPGCGRGHDVLLLSSFGYDVTGLDVSPASIESAKENEKLHANDDVYALREGTPFRGSIDWVVGDFFSDETLDSSLEKFDLIFDYTFFCALPPEARHRWAKRMSSLLHPDGHLVCLEWPLTKNFESGGPPWALTPETYVAHLAFPGVVLKYAADGLDLSSIPPLENPPADALCRLGRTKPKRTHKSGLDSAGKITDFISVWVHTSQI
ncbi:S-adenosyl-L-methionine-dependent methyltransferase [Echria macrotheca]|uniref:S-adenosyl-L-methionine-dependent methyltransferase n=1 Tax=Echria macrotheca TaxID=438768 RepID=A0AAJ0B2X4_9PEZI|nr:S-adenosyl-L-methionine-dependent methyltransferase [Echria macrotheca]